LEQKVLSEFKDRVKDRVTGVLSRPVLTESDKKTLNGLKSRMNTEWKRRILSEYNRRAVSLAKARIVTYANERVLRDPANRIGINSEMGIKLQTQANKVLSLLKVRLLSLSADFGLWLQTPVTVGTIIYVVASWGLAIGFGRLEFPWSYFGYTWGYGALFLTAVTTARLTVNSQRLWLEHRRPARSAVEVERLITETGPTRKTHVLREIDRFFESDLHMGAREFDLKREAFLMRKRDWQLLQDALYDTFLKGAPPLLFELGLRLGSSVGRDLVRISREPGVILSNLEDVARVLGWGTLSVEGDLARGTKVTFKIRESPFCIESQLEQNMRSCHLVEGLVTGICEEIYGWPCSAFEEKCARNGNESCEIVVTQAVAPSKPRERWNLSVLFPTLRPWVRQ